MNPKHPTNIDATIKAVAPDLIYEAPAHWRASHSSAVSYPDDAHNEYAAIEDGSYWFAHRNRCITALVAKNPPKGPIFDIGGGNGVVARALADAGFETVVVEPGGAGIIAAKARELPVIEAGFEEAGFREGSLPAVALFDVLEHIEDDIAMLKRLYASLMPGGRIYLTVPAYPLLWSSEDVSAGHYRRHTLEGLSRRLTGVGFEMKVVTPFFAALVMPVFALRTLPSIYSRRRRKGADIAGDHTLPANILGRAVQTWLDSEYSALAKGRRNWLGTSIFAAAHKV